MTQTQLYNSIQELKALVTNQGKEITKLSATIKAYRKTELDIKEAACFLGVKVKTVHNLVSMGKLCGFKKGKFRYFEVEELEEYLRVCQSTIIER